MFRTSLVTMLLSATAMLFGISANAGIVTVSSFGAAGDFVTIAQALSAALDGDTILVGPGNYNENISVSHEVTILGAGFDQTSTQSFTFYQGATGSTLEGFHCEAGGNAINLKSAADSISIRRCRLVSTYMAWDILAREGGSTGMHLTVEDCIFINTTSTADAMALYNDSCMVRNCLFAHVNPSSSSGKAFNGYIHDLSVINCTFLSYYSLFGITGNNSLLFLNNIVYDWTTSPNWGSYPIGAVFDYNASSGDIPPGTNGLLLTSNPFVDYDESGIYIRDVSDLHLAPGSDCIDAGHPSLLDLDDSRSNIGCYGGTHPLIDTGAPAYPFAIQLDIDPSVIPVGDQLNVETTGRIGPRY